MRIISSEDGHDRLDEPLPHVSNSCDGYYCGCLFVICLLLGVIAYFLLKIYSLLESGDLWKNLLPF